VPENNDKASSKGQSCPRVPKKAGNGPAGRGGGRRADEGTVPARAATATRTVARHRSRVVRGKPYEDVLVEDIAARAGVSRATLYHYFPSKRDLYVAIFTRASNRFLARVAPDPQLPLAEQLAAGLEAHIQSFVDHPYEAVTINRGALSDDPAIQAIIAEELNVVGQRLIDKLVAEGRLREVTEIAVEGWLAFVRAACVKWLQSPNISRTDLTEMCLRAFDCALGHPNKLLASPNVRNMRSRLIALLP
jgi:AcrR family transcriptional regulator